MPGPQFFRSAKPVFFRRSFGTAPLLPKLIRECGNVPFFGRVSAMPMFLLRLQVSLIGVLQRMSGTFMSGQVIFFSVMLSAATMGVGSQVMVFGSNLL
jgi:hypothetical protein